MFDHDPDDCGPVATYGEAFAEYARNAGAERPDTEWILTPWDTWQKNPFFTGTPGRHPEDDYHDDEGEGQLGVVIVGHPMPPRQPRTVDDDDIPF
jgi:hypothetical protein